MDPTETELNGMADLNGVYDWAGLADDVRTKLGEALGNPTLIRDIAYVAKDAREQVVGNLKGLGPARDGAPRAERDLTHVERGRLAMVRRVCFLRLGANPVGSNAPGTPTPAAAPPAGVGSPIGARKIKLSALVDQTLDAEVTALPNGELQKMFEDYKTVYGDLPSTETEPTADQVAAVKQLLVSGSSPYIDFGVFGPHGQRILRKLTFRTYTLNSQGEWAKRELPGPPDFETWFSVYRCMRTTFLLLKAASAERLDSYCEFIRSMHNRFGAQCWDIIYVADTRMRGEEFERIRRRLISEPAHGFTEANPWSAVFAQAVREEGFWNKEVVTEATLRLAQHRTNPVRDLRSELPAPLIGSPGSTTPEPKSSRKKRKAQETEDKSIQDGGVYTHNRRGVEVCALWNKGQCGINKPQSKCLAKPKPRSHQCNRCLGPHQATACPKRP